MPTTTRLPITTLPPAPVLAAPTPADPTPAGPTLVASPAAVPTRAGHGGLLAVGRAGAGAHGERIVRGWRRVHRQAERQESAGQHASRALQVYPDEDGMVVVRGRLEPEAGALLLRALAAAREPA